MTEPEDAAAPGWEPEADDLADAVAGTPDCSANYNPSSVTASPADARALAHHVGVHHVSEGLAELVAEWHALGGDAA